MAASFRGQVESEAASTVVKCGEDGGLKKECVWGGGGQEWRPCRDDFLNLRQTFYINKYMVYSAIPPFCHKALLAR